MEGVGWLVGLTRRRSALMVARCDQSQRGPSSPRSPRCLPRRRPSLSANAGRSIPSGAFCVVTRPAPRRPRSTTATWRTARRPARLEHRGSASYAQTNAPSGQDGGYSARRASAGIRKRAPDGAPPVRTGRRACARASTACMANSRRLGERHPSGTSALRVREPVVRRHAATGAGCQRDRRARGQLAHQQARKELIDLGWIVPEPDDQWAMNRWGRAYRIDLAWGPAAPREGPRLPPPPAPRWPPIATP